MPGFADLPATFTTADARRARVQSRELYRARDGGEVVELSRGVFRKADAPVPAYPDLLAVSHRAPQAVICLLSAAAVHELTDEIPITVQLAIPRGTWAPQIDHPPVEVHTWNPATFNLAVSTIEAAPGEPVRVYSPERTVVDLIRRRHRIGEPLAHGALRRYLARPDAHIGTVVDLADTLGVLGPVRTALDILAAA